MVTTGIEITLPYCGTFDVTFLYFMVTGVFLKVINVYKEKFVGMYTMISDLKTIV